VAIEVADDPARYLPVVQSQPGVQTARLQGARIEARVTDPRAVTPHLVRRLVERGPPSCA
jgi:hypothetical protein